MHERSTGEGQGIFSSTTAEICPSYELSFSFQKEFEIHTALQQAHKAHLSWLQEGMNKEK